MTLVTGFLIVKFSSSGDFEKCMLTAEVLFELPSQINPKHLKKTRKAVELQIHLKLTFVHSDQQN